jgi:hypothetical protein
LIIDNWGTDGTQIGYDDYDKCNEKLISVLQSPSPLERGWGEVRNITSMHIRR